MDEIGDLGCGGFGRGLRGGRFRREGGGFILRLRGRRLLLRLRLGDLHLFGRSLALAAVGRRDHLAHRRAAVEFLVHGHEVGAIVVQRRRPDVLDPHLGLALVLELEHFRRALREIDDARADEGPAVIDADDDLAVILEIGDLDIARQRQGRMGGGEPRHVEPLAVRRLAPVEGLAIPGGHTLLVIVRLFLGLEPAARHLIGLADVIAPPAPRHGALARIDRATRSGEGILLGLLLAGGRTPRKRKAHGQENHGVPDEPEHVFPLRLPGRASPVV